MDALIDPIGPASGSSFTNTVTPLKPFSNVDLGNGETPSESPFAETRQLPGLWLRSSETLTLVAPRSGERNGSASCSPTGRPGPEIRM
jgi:hypothetical protein